ncbi:MULTISPECIES: phenylalanine 4-monooxygenase [unclassified Shewanella]|uniref:phenylalanine 4-monooxygenase n=1 Tax=unclassified Shewanella TaxID=196818 RepID=UPI000C85C623|nr:MULTISPECIES: phenylalanine 4-monooxygenase [unclassified Shewanella]MDO6641532.1 phenylalanine 4-monooxygenase [Shewanella sp. 5_MG-2023]MDO6679998.1 phenylalanine 4-monooxygenase [Shewanella sp. 4_MG-2023]PMG31257.1 phenylalanine 4-monooxygenase [Shewanella sp. 10N.286.52.C2]PMG39272.1 phenylalanine 4-monooxygenase [Shewanella sp. 10N.286.52.B9]PMH87435.1 phenylalanine 4-monooxygenase [Shewanella sp. 10N.286.48.B5]
MSKVTNYTAKIPDSQGYIQYTDEEHDIWHQLYQRQVNNMPGRACEAYMHGLDALAMPTNRVPQLKEIDKVLLASTGWQTSGVPALISFGKFFELLANKQFPVATFIRSKEEFDYLQEPDIFHEIFGHCPLLTNPSFAHFSHIYGQLGLAASKEERVFLARLYWFTVEFGLMKAKDDQLNIYGGGILSSPGETLYALSDKPERKPFELLDVLRTPYRIDIMQPIYYVIDNIDFLDEITRMDIMAEVAKARQLGLFAAKFAPKPNPIAV